LLRETPTGTRQDQNEAVSASSLMSAETPSDTKKGRPPRWLVGIVVVALGLLFVGAGWLLDGHAYASSLLQNLGVGFFLVVPLLIIEGLLAQRVDAAERANTERVAEVSRDVQAVETRVRTAEQDLGQLRHELSSRLQDAADADDAMADRAREAFSFGALQELISRALELKAISARGVRARFAYIFECLRVTPVHLETPDGGAPTDGFLLIVEDGTGAEIARSIWTSDQSPTDALLAVAQAWKATGEYHDDSVMDAEVVFGRLINALRVAIERRGRQGDAKMHPLIELVSPTWALTEYGLEHVGQPYQVPGTEVASDEGLEDWRRHMREKIWVHEEDQEAKQNGEFDFWVVSQVAHGYFARIRAAEGNS
jgi:hypothetical protein